MVFVALTGSGLTTFAAVSAALHRQPLSRLDSRFCIRCADEKSTYSSSAFVLIKSRLPIRHKRRHLHLVAENDHAITDPVERSKILEPVLPSQDASPPLSELEISLSNEPKLPSTVASVKPSNLDEQTPPKKVALTARERLRAARVLSRYSESKPAKSEMGRSVLDALRESEKGKKGLPAAPTNLFDDSKRGMPKAGLTFDFPGGFDLFLIAFSFVFISSVMFATTYIVWKVGAIHFNEY